MKVSIQFQRSRFTKICGLFYQFKYLFLYPYSNFYRLFKCPGFLCQDIIDKNISSVVSQVCCLITRNLELGYEKVVRPGKQTGYPILWTEVRIMAPVAVLYVLLVLATSFPANLFVPWNYNLHIAHPAGRGSDKGFAPAKASIGFRYIALFLKSSNNTLYKRFE